MVAELKGVRGGAKGHQAMEALASRGKDVGFLPEHGAENPGGVKPQATRPLPASLGPPPSLGLYHLSPETFGSAVDATGGSPRPPP